VLTPPAYRAELLGAAGADAVAIARTDQDLLEMEPEAFVREVVVGRFAPQAVVEGPGFGFGRNRRGDTDLLAELGRHFGFAVHVVEKVVQALPGHREASPVSSTLVRRLLSVGSVQDAAACLGRPYRLIGRLVPGQGRGRAIGVPTANLDCGRQLLPAEGVYAAVARCSKYNGPAAVNIGPAPTFNQAQSTVEAHLLDFAGELGTGEVGLDLMVRLRGVQKFDSPDVLVAQIQRDLAETRRVAARFALT
jgi:riboflavin kinase/FMN adenylyltransferase